MSGHLHLLVHLNLLLQDLQEALPCAQSQQDSTVRGLTSGVQENQWQWKPTPCLSTYPISLADPLHPQGKPSVELAGTRKQEPSNHLPKSQSFYFQLKLSLTVKPALQGVPLEGIVQGFGHPFAMWFSLWWRWMMPVVIIACDKALKHTHTTAEKLWQISLISDLFVRSSDHR